MNTNSKYSTFSRPLPEPENPNAVPLTTSTVANKRRSKIAHLPKEVRNQVNTMLDEGATYAQIVAWLNEQGHTGITKQNLSDWQRAGYQDWLREAIRRESHVAQREWFFDHLANTDADQVLPLMDKLFVSEFLDTVFGLDTQSLKERLATSPRDFIALFNAYRRLKHDLLDSKTQKPAEPSSLVQASPA